MRRLKILSILTSIMLVVSSVPVQAFEIDTSNDSIESVEYQESTDEEFKPSSEVFAQIGSVYAVTIPKVIVLAGNKTGASKAEYTVHVEGDIAGNEQIKVVPENSVQLFSKDKDPCTAIISQDKVSWLYSNIDKDATGNIESLLSAGRWSGTFYFNIELESDEGLIEYNYIKANKSTFVITKNLSEQLSISFEGNDITKDCSFVIQDENIISLSDNKIISKEIGQTNIKVTYEKDGEVYGLFIPVKVVNCEHEFEKIDTIDATCTEGSIDTYKCKICGDMKTTSETPALGHNFVLDSVIEKTCVKDGVKHFVCTRCDESYDEPVEATGHVYNITNYVTDTPATCEHNGQKSVHCEVCGEIMEDTIVVIPQLPHTFTNYVSNNDATCTQNGTKTARCDVCHNAYDIIEDEGTKLNHPYTETRIEPTCITQGYTYYTCDVCGDSISNIIPALGHDFVNGTCTRCGKFDISELEPGLYNSSYERTKTFDDLLNEKSLYLDENGALTSNIAYLDEAHTLTTDRNDSSDAIEGILILPDTVKTLKTNSIAYLLKLNTIFIPESVTRIEDGAIKGDPELEAIIVDENNEEYQVEDNVLFNKDKSILLVYPAKREGTVYQIPSTVKTLYSGSFNNVALTNILIPDSITSIGATAFKGAKQLKSIDLSKNTAIKSLGSIRAANVAPTYYYYGTFDSCESLTSVKLPESITTIGDGVFRGCTQLKSINLPAGLQKLGRYVFVNSGIDLGDLYLPEITFIANNAFNSVKINSLTTGSDFTEFETREIFDANNEIKKIDLSQSNKLTQLGTFATEGTSSNVGLFPKLTKLEEVHLPNSLTLIGDNTFNGDTALKSLTGINNVTIVGRSAFYGAGDIGDIYMPNVKELRNYCFYNSGIKSFKSGDALENIELTSTFRSCVKLEEVDISSSKVETLGMHDSDDSSKYGTFQGCTALKIVKLPNTLKNIGDNCFKECSAITNITGLENTEILGNNAFYSAGDIGDINMQNIKSIGYYGFYNSGIKSFIAGDKLEKFVSTSTFRNCTKLEEVDISKSKIETLGMFADSSESGSKYGTFEGCTALKTVKLPNTLKNIGDNCFETCSAITSITGLENAEMIGKYAFYKAGDIGNINMKNIKEIRLSAFRYSKIKSFVAGSALVNIEKTAFDSCEDLKTVDISASPMQTLGHTATTEGSVLANGVFSNCTSLTSVKLPSNLTTIGQSVFKGDKALTDCVVPSTVTSIGKLAFYQVPGH